MPSFLAHYYTLPEIQQVADVVGDSLALARAAEKIDADVIVFAGVYFMGETAKSSIPANLFSCPIVMPAALLLIAARLKISGHSVQRIPERLPSPTSIQRRSLRLCPTLPAPRPMPNALWE